MPEKKKIFSALFGDTPEVQAAAAAREQEALKFQDMLNTQKQALEQRRTDDRRLATFNALGNVLTNMVQPLGWSKAGATAPVAPVDNRQYLESFSRLMKDNDDLRNLATMEKDYGFRLAQRDTALGEQAVRRADDARIQNDYANLRHKHVMDEIAARGETQLDVAKYKATHKVSGRGGVPIEDKMLQTAWTQYMAYKKQYDTDTGRGAERKEGSFPTFEEWVGDQFGWNIREKFGSNYSPESSEKKGGFKIQKKGGFKTE